jgi:hypothetical protein
MFDGDEGPLPGPSSPSNIFLGDDEVLYKLIKGETI